MLRAIALCLLIGATMAPSARAASETAPPTRVSAYQPPIPDGPGHSGKCWTDSIAVARSGAWRCMAGNAIYDPCFSVPALAGAVICDANPAEKRPGFALTLTEPLPKASAPAAAPARPWLVQLTDGSACQILTGTIASVSGVDLPYGCSDSRDCRDRGQPCMTGLGADFTRGTVWMADKVTFSTGRDGLKLLRRKRVAVAAVWE